VVRVRAALALNESLVILRLLARNACCTAAVLLCRLHCLQHHDGLFYRPLRELLASRDHVIKVAHGGFLRGGEFFGGASDGVEASLGRAPRCTVPLHRPFRRVSVGIVDNVLNLRKPHRDISGPKPFWACSSNWRRRLWFTLRLALAATKLKKLSKPFRVLDIPGRATGACPRRRL